eukprot:TRINITY_DN4304_c0_g1_i2.p1 TRINITY_DN4304_c0_g1~~TRINITY_DN4304_c0_g1_i2.p1  ORF type:complete len:254 (+),score=90.27 TRINITY_DN4304_c0_g1_i2:83-844(+)
MTTVAPRRSSRLTKSSENAAQKIKENLEDSQGLDVEDLGGSLKQSIDDDMTDFLLDNPKSFKTTSLPTRRKLKAESIENEGKEVGKRRKLVLELAGSDDEEEGANADSEEEKEEEESSDQEIEIESPESKRKGNESHPNTPQGSLFNSKSKGVNLMAIEARPLIMSPVSKKPVKSEIKEEDDEVIIDSEEEKMEIKKEVIEIEDSDPDNDFVKAVAPIKPSSQGPRMVARKLSGSSPKKLAKSEEIPPSYAVF